jgi:hypothetical protein
VNVDRQLGYIDRTGKLVIGPLPYEGRNFSNGLAQIEALERCTTAESKQKYGFIDRNGRVVIPVTLTRPCNSWGDQFYFRNEGLALTNIGDKWGFIDKTGKVVMQFDEAGQFSEGLAAAKVNGKFGYIDTHGKILDCSVVRAGSAVFRWIGDGAFAWAVRIHRQGGPTCHSREIQRSRQL